MLPLLFLDGWCFTQKQFLFFIMDIYICIYMHIWTYICVYIHIYTHTYIQVKWWQVLIAANKFHIFWCRFCAITKYILVKNVNQNKKVRKNERKKNSHFISLVFYTPIINKTYLPSPSQCHNLFYSYGLQEVCHMCFNFATEHQWTAVSVTVPILTVQGQHYNKPKCQKAQSEILSFL